MDKLLSCPFCGGDNIDPAFSRGYRGGDEYQPLIAAGCYDCSATGPAVRIGSVTGYADSAEAWNKRTQPTTQSLTDQIKAIPWMKGYKWVAYSYDAWMVFLDEPQEDIDGWKLDGAFYHYICDVDLPKWTGDWRESKVRVND